MCSGSVTRSFETSARRKFWSLSFDPQTDGARCEQCKITIRGSSKSCADFGVGVSRSLSLLRERVALGRRYVATWPCNVNSGNCLRRVACLLPPETLSSD